MIGEYDDSSSRDEDKLKTLLEEENHLARMSRVFGTPEGLDIVEWIITDLCGYWRPLIESDRQMGRFELGMSLFNLLCLADIKIVYELMDRRRRAAELVRLADKRKLERSGS